MRRTTKTAPGALDRYLGEISRVALLTVDEEQRLARAFRDHGDTRAAHRLVEANLRFVDGGVPAPRPWTASPSWRPRGRAR